MSSSDVIIVGAGAVGCATAYFLTRQGVKPIVIEKDAIGDHASGFALGGLSPFEMGGHAGIDSPLQKEAMRLHVQLAEELEQLTGIDTAFKCLPILALAADEQEKDSLTANLPWLLSDGYAAQWLDGEEVRRWEPRLASSLVGALRVDGSALLESYRYTLALAVAAEKAGAQIRHGEVMGLRVEHGRVTAVVTRTSTIPCERVVLAIGPWTGPASVWLGVHVPIYPLKGQIVRLRLPGPPIEGRFAWRSNYFATKPDGLIWAGTTEEEVGFDDTTTDAARDEIIISLAELFPPLLDAEIVQQTACLRPASVDGLPIISGVTGVDGLFVVTGGGRRGILLSSIMGSIGADLVLNGQSPIDIAPFSLERFRLEPGSVTREAG